jgi:hypothetical protein
MLASDLVGFVGSLSLLIPAAKDQLYRFKTDQQTRKSEHSPWPGVRKGDCLGLAGQTGKL